MTQQRTFTGAVNALALESWFLMLVLGAVHSVAAGAPAIGYGTAVLFMIGLNMVAGYTRRIFRK